MEGDAVYLADPVAIEEFQSTPSVWRETAQSIAINSDYKISIHSLRMEGDSITPLLYLSALIFQSTPSVWRETERHAL